MRDCFSENCETLKKGTKYGTRRWDDLLPIFMIRKIKIVKIFILLKTIYRFYATIIKVTTATEIEKN